MNLIYFNFLNNLSLIIPIKTLKIIKNEITIIVLSSYLEKICYFLKNYTQTYYQILTSISGVDYPQYSQRFEVVYEFLSLVYNSRLRLKTYVDQSTSLKSLNFIYPSANWWEREIWDLFGILFLNHPDLRRILTDYGFEGCPLKKDFPLTGYIEIYYDNTQKRVICTPIKQLSQQFKSY
jgi:NADH/F420H2 dehydrogenase subunit C